MRRRSPDPAGQFNVNAYPNVGQIDPAKLLLLLSQLSNDGNITNFRGLNDPVTQFGGSGCAIRFGNINAHVGNPDITVQNTSGVPVHDEVILLTDGGLINPATKL